jgi:hypothetical protein
VQIVQQIIGPNGEIQQIPIQLSPQQLQVRAYFIICTDPDPNNFISKEKKLRKDVISAEL